ncbi:MFS transporter [Paractinoplanes abujensis]|uniref:MFS family permease n=1 Tax=Paractinoplanes abujensis TaxID=882441 RepID=A0A7W7CQI3_9ACTN|nr:MFS transporter [Actinoplanes abujensis]MBB4692867.1 MFS family permease [Actinoplanes abujensis]GID22632.1 MFS transporter [Actinoplanes abujensis]
MTTYRELFAYREFRFLYGGQVLSSVGDQVAAVAVAVLVFDRTNNALLSAIAYASAWLPGVLGGPILSTYADRLPRRAVLIGCDLARAGLIALVAVPGLPLWCAIVLLYVAHLFSPPFVAARAAVMPEVLPGEAYIAGNGLGTITSQLSQLFGFVAGGVVVAAAGPVWSLAGNAVTFALSALLIAVGVAHRPAAVGEDQTTGLLAQTRDGIRFILADPWLRSCLALVWVASAFSFAPEAIAYPWAVGLGGGPAAAGLLLAAPCVGFLVGALLLTRVFAAGTRDRMIVPAAVLSTAALIPALFGPGLAIVLILLALAGAGASFGAPLNAVFVRRVAPGFRGRAMGVAASGLLVVQGLGFLVAGAVVEAGVAPSVVVGAGGLLGTVAVVLISASWRRATATASVPDQA